ncbi:hypothetical protein SAMN05192534_12391 [Alteribacillus persepolensis]|uniref:Uncharacterized protein n=1 Tax=Alteribacillus persepolensis TaxID=568899 RepID=A0A1G8ICD3_9BACI|nr:hypothetical protein [Alteribacillus persepolensis]SDI16678.1 hypothetical protein SAMN05192534_12391 [Alteribacillus persepolensis]
MKFKLDQTVIFEGEKVIVWDYSHRYKDYEIKKENGDVVRGLSENQLKEM